MRARHFFVFTALLLVGCGAQRPNPAEPLALPKSTSPKGYVRKEDPELDAAIAKARESLDTFVARLHTPKRGEVFSIEAGFQAPDGSTEHLWLGDVTHSGDTFKGTVTTKPSKVTAVKYGEMATVKQADVTDWMILNGGNSEGGFTVDVLIRRQGMPR